MCMVCVLLPDMHVYVYVSANTRYMHATQVYCGLHVLCMYHVNT